MKPKNPMPVPPPPPAPRSDWEENTSFFNLGLGIALGVGLTAIAHALWMISASPTFEIMLEGVVKPSKFKRLLSQFFPQPMPPKTERRIVMPTSDAERLAHWDYLTVTEPSDPASELDPIAQKGILRVLISDPHIDNWPKLEQTYTNPKDPNDPSNGMARRAVDFIEFLKTLRVVAEKSGRYTSVELYINGDLTDIPLHAAHEGRIEPDEMLFEASLSGWEVTVNGNKATWEGVLPKSLDRILMQLREIVRDDDPRLRIFYFTGNHDIGISGLRYFRPQTTRNVLDVPAHVMWNPGGIIKDGPKWVYLEHGHMHDPVLLLYVRYAFLDMLRGGFRHQQRRLLGRMQRSGKEGMNAYDGPMLNEAPSWQPGTNRFKDAIVAIVRLRYRSAARKTAQWLHRDYPGQPFTIVFGHTHLEDKWSFNYRGTPYAYINAGSWAGTQDRQTFWIVEPSGQVNGPFGWWKHV